MVNGSSRSRSPLKLDSQAQAVIGQGFSQYQLSLQRQREQLVQFSDGLIYGVGNSERPWESLFGAWDGVVI